MVCLRNMQNKELHHLIQRGTSKLIESTVDALDDDALKLLLVLVQQTNVELCIKSAVESGIITDAAQALADQAAAGTFKPGRRFLMDLFKWFPYVWTKDTLEDKGTLFGEEFEPEYYKFFGFGFKYFKYFEFKGYNLAKAAFYFQEACIPFLSSLTGSLPPPLQVLIVGLLAIIVAANAFWLQPGDVNALTVQNVFELYIKSGGPDRIRAAVMGTLSGLVGPYNTPLYKAKLVQIALNIHAGFEGSKSSGSIAGPSSMA